jgi:cytidyltransferase-like protein
MTRVYVDMVADLFHYGHVEFLRTARGLGDELVVGVHSDAVVSSYKRAPVMRMAERIRVVEGCRFVDEVIPEAPLTVSESWVTQHRLDLVVHGDDFDTETARCFYGYPMDAGIFRAVRHTIGISTSDIIERILDRLAAGDL